MTTKTKITPAISPEQEARLAQAREQIARGEIGTSLSSDTDIEAYLERL